MIDKVVHRGALADIASAALATDPEQRPSLEKLLSIAEQGISNKAEAEAASEEPPVKRARSATY